MCAILKEKGDPHGMQGGLSDSLCFPLGFQSLHFTLSVDGFLLLLQLVLIKLIFSLCNVTNLATIFLPCFLPTFGSRNYLVEQPYFLWKMVEKKVVCLLKQNLKAGSVNRQDERDIPGFLQRHKLTQKRATVCNPTRLWTMFFSSLSIAKLHNIQGVFFGKMQWFAIIYLESRIKNSSAIFSKLFFGRN